MADELITVATASVLTKISQKDIREAMKAGELQSKGSGEELTTSSRWIKEWLVKLWLSGSKEYDPTFQDWKIEKR